MTDQESLVGMLQGIGLDPVVTPGNPRVPPEDLSELIVTAGDSEQVLGYSGFVVHFYFTPEGALVKMGIWE